MKQIITNKYNLTDSDMTEVVKRVKVLLVNSNNDVLLGYSHNNYQLYLFSYYLLILKI